MARKEQNNNNKKNGGLFNISLYSLIITTSYVFMFVVFFVCLMCL